jgi:hypothetical protein
MAGPDIKIMPKSQNMKRNNKNNKKQRRNMRNFGMPPGSRIQGSLNEPIPRNLPIPNNTRVTLKYADYYILTSSAGVATATYSGNSCYDPDITFIGHQPYYFDKYASLYQYYTVLGSRFVLRTNVDTGSNQGVVVGLLAYKNNGVANSQAGLSEIMESKYGVSKLFLNNPVQSFTLRNSQRTPTMLSTSQSELINNITYRTLCTTAPASDIEWFYKILALNVDNSTTAFGIAVSIEIEYDVVFTVPKDEPPSLRAPTAGVRMTKIEKREESKESRDKFTIIDDSSSISSRRGRN